MPECRSDFATPVFLCPGNRVLCKMILLDCVRQDGTNPIPRMTRRNSLGRRRPRFMQFIKYGFHLPPTII